MSKDKNIQGYTFSITYTYIAIIIWGEPLYYTIIPVNNRLPVNCNHLLFHLTQIPSYNNIVSDVSIA